MTIKYVLEKEPFYEKLKSFASNKYLNIFFFHDFGDKKQYTICFCWSPKKPNGEDNFIASCQLYDNRKSGSKKYIANDLIFDMRKENVKTDYKLYKFLREWVQESVASYEGQLKV